MDQQISEERAGRMAMLAQTGPDTPMGRLLRKFWHPVGISNRLAAKSAMAVRVLSEDLTLYRGESGRAYLIGGRCLHRLTRLDTGWVEGEEIRCMYHGWKYDGAGRCTERPAERAALSENYRLANYPTYEYCGLIFAYLGAEPAPEFDLLRNEAFEAAGYMTFNRVEVWPCNWFQHVENSLDPVHVSFAHQMGKVGEFGKAITTVVPDLSYEETTAGIKQTARRSENNVRVSDWTFPNCNHVRVPGLKLDDPWIHTANWMVPVDDARTARFSLRRVPSTTKEADARVAKYFNEAEFYNAADEHEKLLDKHVYPEDPLIRLTSAQDYVALMGQGEVADRVHELLGSSDKGVSFLRRIFLRELSAIERTEPTKTWSRCDRPIDLPVPQRSASSER